MRIADDKLPVDFESSSDTSELIVVLRFMAISRIRSQNIGSNDTEVRCPLIRTENFFILSSILKVVICWGQSFFWD